MSAKKLTLPDSAPKIPDGWEYKGTKFKSKTPIMWAFWDGDGGWSGIHDKTLAPLVPINDYHYITPIKHPAVKPSPAKAKRAGKPVKARRFTAKSHNTIKRGIPVFIQYDKPSPVFVLPADADSVARMAEQVATVLAGTSGTNMSDAEVAAEVLATIGIAGRRK